MPTLAFPKRHTHADVRFRASLTAAEVDHRRNTARRVGRHGLRHATMLLASRHGLRVSALMALRWDQLDSAHGCFHGRRLERGEPSTHLFTAGERRALRRLKRAAPDAASVWGSERKGPLTDASVRTMIAQAGEITALGVPVHAHQLRYGCGSPLANTQQDTRVIPVDMGHTTIQQTAQDTELAAERVQDLWRD